MTISVHFSPDDWHILSATKSDAVLLADWYDYDETDPHGLLGDGKCIVRVSRDLYFECMTAWLDGKASYHEHGGEFAGQGHITLEDLTLLPDPAYLSAHLVEQEPEDLDIDTPEGIAFFSRRVPVPHLRATEFEIEMEHG